MFPSRTQLLWKRWGVSVAESTERPGLERREHSRVECHLSCRLAMPWNALDPCVGVAENLSRNGLLIRWKGAERVPQLPDIGASLAVALEWPVRGPSGQLFLLCQGKVVRVWAEAEGAARFVAMEVSRMSFRNTLSPSGKGRTRLLEPR